MAFPLPPNESERLRVLRRYQILDTPAEAAFDRVTNVARQIFDVPIALVSLIDENRQFFKSCIGLDISGTPRDVAFCTYTILADEVMVVPDAQADARFADNPLVTGPPYIRFYAGAPLHTKEGLNIGTLCIIDRKPRSFDAAQQAMLRDLSDVIVSELDLRYEVGQRLQAEAFLRESEQRKSAILESALDCIITIDGASRIVEFNASAERTFGYDRSEVLGQSMTELLIPSRYREAHQQGMVRYKETSKGRVLNKRIEITALHADGHEFPIELAISPIHLEDGRTFFTAHIRDISKRKAAEQAIRKSEAKSAALLEAIPDALFRLDENGIFLDYISAEGFMPYQDPSAFLGQRVDEVMPPEMAREILAYIKETIRTGTAQRHEYSLTVGDTLQHFEARYVRDEAGTVLTMVRDVSDIYGAEEALRKSESRYRYLVESASDIIFLSDARGHFTYANAVAKEITGYEVIGMHYLDLVHPTSRHEVRAFYVRQMRGRNPTTYLEFPIRTCSGEHRWVGQSLQLVQEGERIIGLQGVVRDITQRRATEKALREALAKERELGELKSRFVSMISHEFRTPLSMIYSAVHLARRFVEMGSAKADKYFTRIEEGVQEMTSLLEDVLLLGRMEAGRLPFNPETIEIEDFLDELLGEIRLGVGRQHHIFIHGAERCASLEADKKLLRVMCNNLITNAIKYSEEDSVVIIRLECTSEALILRVQDKGIGIPEADLERLLEPFHRASNVGTIQGTGLGLALVQRAVERHKGELTVESEVGNGSTFEVVLPLVQDANAIKA